MVAEFKYTYYGLEEQAAAVGDIPAEALGEERELPGRVRRQGNWTRPSWRRCTSTPPSSRGPGDPGARPESADKQRLGRRGVDGVRPRL